MGDICKNKCWCEFCSKPIEKGEKYLVIYKQAQKGRVRINICKKCLIIHKKRIRKEYYQKHKKEEYEQTKIWKSKNKDRVKENWERWYQKNKVRIKKKRKNEDIKEGRRKDARKI